MQILLERCEKEIEQRRQEQEQAANEQRFVKRAAECAGMSLFEAEQHEAAVKEAERIPELEKRKENLSKDDYAKIKQRKKEKYAKASDYLTVEEAQGDGKQGGR